MHGQVGLPVAFQVLRCHSHQAVDRRLEDGGAYYAPSIAVTSRSAIEVNFFNTRRSYSLYIRAKEREGTMSITPYLYYEDVDGALKWLAKAFGFRKYGHEMSGSDGKINHAAMKLGGGV